MSSGIVLRESMKIRRDGENSPYSVVIFPHIDANIIVVPAYPRSLLLLNTPELVICNHLVDDKFTYHFFISGPEKVDWCELPDEQRMAIRTSNYGSHKSISLRRSEFPYEDERYYTLEALI